MLRHHSKVCGSLRRSQRIAIASLKQSLLDADDDRHGALSATSHLSTPRRSKRLIEQQLRALETQRLTASSLIDDSYTPTRRVSGTLRSPVHTYAKISPTPHTKRQIQTTSKTGTAARDACQRRIHFAASPVKQTPPRTSRVVRSLTTSPVDIPLALLQMDQACSDAEWLWKRMSVPLENLTSPTHLFKRRGKFLQLACESRDASLVRTVYDISRSPAYRDNDKWHFVDAVHYGVEYQLHDLLPWLDAIETQMDPALSFQSTSRMMNMALVHGDLRIAAWLYDHRLHTRTELIWPSTKRALGRHSRELLEWVVAHYPTLFARADDATDAQKHTVHLVDAVKHMRGDAVFCTAFDEAVASNNVEVVQYLLAHGSARKPSPAALAAATGRGHVDVLACLQVQPQEHEVASTAATPFDASQC